MFLFLILILFNNLSAYINEKVIICGVCRDVETRLPYTMQIMEQMGSLFKDYRIIVYENNSIDNTKAFLQYWMSTNFRVNAETENLDFNALQKIIVNIKEGKFFKPEEIALARNKVLAKALSSKYEGFDYVIWMDMDFKIPPSFEGIVETFQCSQKWDAVFAYGIDPAKTYWDWYALRDKSSPLGSEVLGNTWWYLPKTLKLTKKDPWYPVYSAFGGCGIYKKSSIQGCRYSAVVTDELAALTKKIIKEGVQNHHPHVDMYFNQLKTVEQIVKLSKPMANLPRIENPNIGILINDDADPVIFRMSSFVYQYPSVCEHVPFHFQMILNGHDKLYINPRLIFNYGG